MPSHNCRHPTCGAILPARGYCPRHQVQAAAAVADRHRAYDQTERDREAKRFYDSADWRRARAAALAACPWCAECKRDWATAVHHIVPLAECTFEQRTAQDNLMSVCATCHGRIEARARLARRRAGSRR